jgi:uncharacterized protein YqhQ
VPHPTCHGPLGSISPPQGDGSAPHYYGGQAVVEGVMMRGQDTWAVAVRRPKGDIYLERHGVSDLPQRKPIWRKPMLRGCYALFDAMSVGVKALSISAQHAMDEEEEPLDGKLLGGTLLFALLLFIGIFIVLPNALLALARDALGDGFVYHFVESVFRIAIFIGYLALITLLADIRRVFMYHGAEHKTIAAWEQGDPLRPDVVDRYSTLHVRCGTNFLIMVMLLALVIYTAAGVAVPPPADIGWVGVVIYHVGLRVVLLPVVAGLAYEGLRLGARRGDHPLVAALMRPGLWLQKITTRPPTEDQIEVAIRAFEAVVPANQLDGRIAELPSELVFAVDEATPEEQLPDGRGS